MYSPALHTEESMVDYVLNRSMAIISTISQAIGHDIIIAHCVSNSLFIANVSHTILGSKRIE